MCASLLKLLLLASASVSSVFVSQAPEKIKDIEELRRSIEASTVSAAERKAFGLDCQDRALLNYAFFQRGERAAVLQVFGNGCSEKRVLLVFGGEPGNWTLIATLQLSSHYDEQPTVTFPSLIEPGVQEIMVEHQIVDWGTGVLEKFTTIYKWIDGHLRVVFDEPDSVHLEEASSASPDNLYEFDQTNTFRVEVDNESSEKTIEERQTITLGKRKIILSRGWIWEPSLQRFRGYETGP